jgi:tetratricopeptide (TPR) repeat protein
VDVKQIARELGVRYVLEGSVRRAGNRLRITGQLVDATTGEHHWAERYDREMGDIFALQDEITRSVAAAIEPKLLAAEGIRFSNRSPADLGAWELVTRALTHFARLAQTDTVAGIELLEKAVERYPDYAPVHALLGFYFVLARHMGWVEPERAMAGAQRHAERAAELDESDPRAHMAFGYIALMNRRTDDMIRSFRHAVELNPNSAMAVGCLGFGLAHTERDAEAIAFIDESVRLSPHDPHNVLFFGALTLAHYLAGRFDKAIEAASLAVRLRPGFQGARRLLAASLAQSGRAEEAKSLMDDIRRQQPGLTLDWVRRNVPLQTPEQMERFLDGLRKSGLTE